MWKVRGTMSVEGVVELVIGDSDEGRVRGGCVVVEEC
jgi:hypothetical protein